MDLSSILQRLLSPNNEMRKLAEKEYEHFKSKEMLFALLQVLVNPLIDPSLHQLGCTLLRRLICHEHHFQHFATDEKCKFQAELLSTLKCQHLINQSSTLCDMIGYLVAYEVNLQDWRDLLDFIFDCLQNYPPHHTLYGYGVTLLGYSSIHHRDLFLNPQCLPIVTKTMETCLIHHENNLKLPILGIKAMANIFESISQESSVPVVDHWVNLLFQSLNLLLQRCLQPNYDENTIYAFLEVLIDVIEEFTQYFISTMSTYVPHLLHYFEEKLLPGSVKNMILELLIVLSAQAPKYVRKLKDSRLPKGYLFSYLLSYCVHLMLSVPDESDWHLQINVDEDDDNSSDHVIGESSIDRLSKALGLKFTLQTMVSQIGQLLHSQDWKSNYVGLRILGNYLEVTVNLNKKELARHQQEISSTLLVFSSMNKHYRVKAAAFYAIGQLFLMHGAKLSDDIAQVLFARLLESIAVESSGCPRLKLYV